MSDFTGQDIGRYHVIEQLGRGGMAIVYRAFDTRLERDVAIKFIRKDAFDSDYVPQMLKRFEREAKALAQLSHPNIVKVHDYGEYQGTPYLVMEYLPGGTLKQLIGHPMPPAQAAQLLLPIARALAYAHRQGIIHRDVKPANILITRSGDPMLTDFGIARILQGEGGAGVTSLTATGVGIGTPDYMAPEQWNNEISPQTDVYALGTVLFELVTGTRPFTADTPAAVLFKQINDPLPRPRSLVPNLSDEVEAVLYKALAKSPQERYANMDVFAQALEALTREKEAPTLTLPDGARREKTATVQAPLPPPPTPVTSPPGTPERRPARSLGAIVGIGVLMGGLILVTLVIIAVGSYLFLAREATPLAAYPTVTLTPRSGVVVAVPLITEIPTPTTLPSLTPAASLTPPPPPTDTPSPSATATATASSTPTATASPTITLAIPIIALPKITPLINLPDIPLISFRFCDQPCNQEGVLPRTEFPDTTQVYFAIDYSGVKPGEKWNRSWSNGGQNWVTYQNCEWHDQIGSFSGRLWDMRGLRAGEWTLSVIYNNRVYQGSFTIQGKVDYWDPPGVLPCPQ